MMPFKIVEALAEGREITLFDDGALARDLTPVDDIVDGFLRALDRPFGFEIINLGRGVAVSIAELLARLERVSGLRARTRSAPAPPTDAPVTCASTEKAGRLLGYTPSKSIEPALEELWRWYRSNHLQR
jgi:UDP-glucuronate 4-epimerase